MPELKDFLPSLPPSLPLPRFLIKKQPAEITTVQHVGCEQGIDCIKDHMGRAHLYMNESIRFSSGGLINDQARQKVRQARAELQCEDDFGAAMEAPPEIRSEILKLLASCRSTWKAMDKSGVDSHAGSIEDLREIRDAIKALWDKSYEINRQYQLAKEE